MPDGAAYFSKGAANYIVTANEGDARDEDVEIAELELDPNAFPDAESLQLETNLGVLEVGSSGLGLNARQTPWLSPYL